MNTRRILLTSGFTDIDFRFEIPRNVYIQCDPFTEANGSLTPTYDSKNKNNNNNNNIYIYMLDILN